MEELEEAIVEIFGKFATIKIETKRKRIPSEMNLMIDLKNNEIVIKEYLQGFSIEEISLKNDLSFKDVDEIIDCYNYLYS